MLGSKAHILLFLVLMTAFASCRNSCSPQEYLAWINNADHGLVKEKLYSNIRYEVQYRPSEMMALLSLGEESLGDVEFNKEVLRYQRMQYYRLRLEATVPGMDVFSIGVTNNRELLERKYFFSFDLDRFLWLVCDAETLSCSFLHHQETNGITPYEEFLVAFPNCAGKVGRQLIIDDIGFQTGVTKFYFDETAIGKLPDVSP